VVDVEEVDVGIGGEGADEGTGRSAAMGLGLSAGGEGWEEGKGTSMGSKKVSRRRAGWMLRGRKQGEQRTEGRQRAREGSAFVDPSGIPTEIWSSCERYLIQKRCRSSESV